MCMITALAVSPMRHPRDLLPGHGGDKLPGNSAVLSATACYSRINPLVRFHCPLASMAVMTLCIILKMPRLNGFHFKPGNTQAPLPSNMKISKVPLKIMTIFSCIKILIISLYTPCFRTEEWTEMVDLNMVLIFHNKGKGQLHPNMNSV